MFDRVFGRVFSEMFDRGSDRVFDRVFDRMFDRRFDRMFDRMFGQVVQRVQPSGLLLVSSVLPFHGLVHEGKVWSAWGKASQIAMALHSYGRT